MYRLKIRSETNTDKVIVPAIVPSIMPASAPLLIPRDEVWGNSVTVKEYFSSNLLEDKHVIS